jgi:PAS domain S-box-containing protein
MELQKHVSAGTHSFLQGGGEMGELTRKFNWSETSIGAPHTWPQSLRTTVAMVLSSKFPMFIWWGEDLVQFYNDAYRPSLGNNGKHPLALGQKGKDCWPEIWDIIHPLIQQVLNTGEATWSEDQLVPIYRNGKIEDVYWTFGYSALRNDLDEIEGVLVVCTETTEKVKTVRNLIESEKRFLSIVESTPFPIGVYVGREMRIAMANKSITDIWGKGENVVGKLYADVLPELENQNIYEQLDRVYTTGTSFHAKNQRVDLVIDGILRPFYFNYSFTPLYDGNGNIYGVMNTAADVTDLNIAKQKIEQSETNLRNMVLQAPVAMCILMGPEHIIEVANDLIIELWGKTREAVMHKPVFVALPDAREQGLEALMASVYNTGEAFIANERPVALLREGRLENLYLNFVYDAYKNADGHIVGIFAIAIDVTQQVLARQKIEDVVTERTRELEIANNNLQKSNEELAQFAYVASHDLKEPVRKVSIFTEMLENNLGATDELSKKYLSRIKNAASRMYMLIEDVLEYSELSRTSQVYTKVDLQLVIEDIKTDFELLIEEKGAVIQSDLPAVDAVSLQMFQLFGNLISNALKFSKPGIKPAINLTHTILSDEELHEHPKLNKHTRYYKIEVHDNGIGFSPDYAAQIFNIFQRLHAKKEYEGTGIGLAMCQKIVENHGGEIYATSQEGIGSTFTIILPVQQPVE